MKTQPSPTRSCKAQYRAWLAGGACALVAAVALAAGDGHRQLGVHEHGTGHLDLVLDGSSLEIALEGPMANFVGFEHAPRNSAEEMAVQQVLSRLRDAPRLFRIPVAASCQLTDVSIDAPPDAGHADEDHDHDEAHADIAASYVFRCGNPAALSHVDVLLFADFPGTKQLVGRVIAPGRQGGATLTPGKNRLDVVAR
ncbi:MAG: DUF2796 domain-containing protein [Gammaproteobacteria bacterium]|nr:DUF2796 domain-containing protein [Gammaproteobacteria bacterium]